MPLHIEFETNIKVYGDSSKNQGKGALRIPDSVIDALTVESSARVHLAADDADIAFNMQSVTSGKLVLLQSDDTFSFTLNGGDPITLKPRTNSEDNTEVPVCAMLMSDGITSLALTNPSSTDAIDVDVCIAG